MTEDAKERYEEDKPHYEVIRSIVQEVFKPLERNINAFFIIALAVFGFMFLTQFLVWQVLSEKATITGLEEAIKERERDYLMKLDYYKMEVEEHEKIQECFAIPSRIPFVMKSINDHLQYELNLQVGPSRGATK